MARPPMGAELQSSSLIKTSRLSRKCMQYCVDYAYCTCNQGSSNSVESFRISLLQPGLKKASQLNPTIEGVSANSTVSADFTEMALYSLLLSGTTSVILRKEVDVKTENTMSSGITLHSSSHEQSHLMLQATQFF